MADQIQNSKSAAPATLPTQKPEQQTTQHGEGAEQGEGVEQGEGAEQRESAGPLANATVTTVSAGRKVHVHSWVGPMLPEPGLVA